MNVNAMHRNPATNSAQSPAALLRRGAFTSLGAALVAGLLAGHLAEPVIIVAVIVVASLIGWHRTPLVPARVRSQHRFTMVSRRGDGYVTIDSHGVRRVARRLVSGDTAR
jgi:hypothetical protein